MEGSSRKKGSRGASWHHSETKELIDAWGERQVQIQLNSRHRNIDVYERIAAGLRRKGFKRTAEECRTKAKSLKRTFKKAKASGKGKVTMPFFQELQEILAGDRSVRPGRDPQALEPTFGQGGRDRGETAEMPPESQEEPFPPQEGSEEHFSQDMEAEIKEETYSLNWTADPEEDVDSDEDPMEDACQELMEIINLSESDAARHPKSLTVAERMALMWHEHEVSSFEKMVDKMIENSNSQLDRLLAKARMGLEEDTSFHKSFLEQSREMVSIFREQTNLLRDIAGTVAPQRQRGAVVGGRTGMRPRI